MLTGLQKYANSKNEMKKNINGSYTILFLCFSVEPPAQGPSLPKLFWVSPEVGGWGVGWGCEAGTASPRTGFYILFPPSLRICDDYLELRMDSGFKGTFFLKFFPERKSVTYCTVLLFHRSYISTCHSLPFYTTLWLIITDCYQEVIPYSEIYLREKQLFLK